MKYIKAIFENQNVQALVSENEELADFATQVLINYNTFLEMHSLLFVDNYIEEGDLVQTYANIRDDVIANNVAFIGEMSNILSNNTLSLEEKVKFLVEVDAETNDKKTFLQKHKNKLLAGGALAAMVGAGALGYRNRDAIAATISDAKSRAKDYAAKAGTKMSEVGDVMKRKFSKEELKAAIDKAKAGIAAASPGTAAK